MSARNKGTSRGVNPAIIGGFGGNDESSRLADDNNSAPKQQPGNRQSRLTLSTNHTSRSNPSQPTFRYRRPSFLDDLESSSDFLYSIASTRETASTQKENLTPQRGYAPVSASILDITNLNVANTDPNASSSKFRNHTSPSSNRPQLLATSSVPASASSYFALSGQHGDTMTTKYLCRLEQSGNQAADDFRCPECRELLEYVDIQRYADKQTFTRYETLALRAAVSEAENFIWCTSGCGSGQIHESGSAQPIVICLHCSHRSCFHHNVAWHETLSCEEYDQLLADPENFRSRLELENETWPEAQQAQLEADRAIAQGLLAEDRTEMRRREERALKAAQLAREIAARRKEEEDESKATVKRTTKPCAGCGWAIEKNQGCSHMILDKDGTPELTN
ncbi:hypothetical protein F66182_6520 [Fusarium sp. NRRL 66182]|nr:hypothetical protein F66182_6520 [Fusarium sp. NRRL 66182]